MTTPPITPRASRRDELYSARQAVEFYGDRIDAATAKLLMKTLQQFYDRGRMGGNRKAAYAGNRGPTSAKHYKQGHREAFDSAKSLLLENCINQYAPELLQRWSRSGAESEMLTIIRNLCDAAEANLY